MNEAFPLDIIFADETLIAVNKPAGLLSIPDGYKPALPYLASELAKGFGKVWIVHRLDRETSGMMVVARTIYAHRELNLQFEHRQVQKIYHTLVAGFPNWESIEVDTPLKVNGDRRHRTVPAPGEGKKARTTFKVISRYANGCLIEARPHSGYTHQIRAHLANLGFPIFGDNLYHTRQQAASVPDNPLLTASRTCLHARSISFEHPLSRKSLSFEAAYPPDFLEAIRTLK